ncbi:MAG TPA: pseudouridine synthase [Polyangiaceae bacterium]|jgi:23S rRNA pseudouridine2605 synthase|nr:pseudouridine synthase [Polyangiaceae bacterium]
MSQERLQKILARAGVASRRNAEDLVRSGRVTVDGRRVTEIGTKADPKRQRIELDGKLLEAEPLLYVLFHKPRQVMCTTKDPEGRPTVLDFLQGVGARVVPIGRLDYHTSGVLLLTNDGEFAAALAHPTKKVEKVYVAKVNAPFEERELEQWSQSIEIDGKKTQPALVKKLRTEGDKVWIEVRLHEGKNRQVHRIGEAAGSAVLRLARVSFAGITHEGVRPGQWRYLSKDELTLLKKSFGVPKKIFPAPPLPNAKAVRRVRSSGTGKGDLAVVTPKRARTKRPLRKQASGGLASSATPRSRVAVETDRTGTGRNLGRRTGAARAQAERPAVGGPRRKRSESERFDESSANTGRARRKSRS